MDDLMKEFIDTKPDNLKISLEDPAVFAKLLSFASVGRDNNLQLHVQYNGHTISYLGKKQFNDTDQKMNIPYGFSKDGKDLAYHAFGTALDRYDAKTVQRIARIVLRLMRSASRHEATPEDIEKTQLLLTEIAKVKKNGDYSPLELVGQLLTASAAEAGRAQTGYLNNYVTLHRLKHKPANKLMNGLLREIFPLNPKIPSEIKVKQKETQAETKSRLARLEAIEAAMQKDKDAHDKTRHATAFGGSQHAMRVYSGLEELKQYKDYGNGNVSHWNRKNQFNAERYKNMTERDQDYLTSSNSKKDSSKSKWTKMAEHYKAAVNHEKTNYYEKDNIDDGNKPKGDIVNNKEEKTETQSFSQPTINEPKVKSNASAPNNDILMDDEEESSKKERKKPKKREREDDVKTANESKSKSEDDGEIKKESEAKRVKPNSDNEKTNTAADAATPKLEDEESMDSLEEDKINEEKRRIANEQKKLETKIFDQHKKIRYSADQLHIKSYSTIFSQVINDFKDYKSKYPDAQLSSNLKEVKKFIDSNESKLLDNIKATNALSSTFNKTGMGK